MSELRNVKVEMALSREYGSGSVQCLVWKVAASGDGRAGESVGVYTMMGAVLLVGTMAARRWCRINGRSRGRFISRAPAVSLLSASFIYMAIHFFPG